MAANTSAVQARKFNAALFHIAQKMPAMVNHLTGEAPKQQADQGKTQTDPGAPIVRITDLSKDAGLTVSVDIQHRISKRPTMGDRKLEGRGDNLTFATDNIKIDQTRHMVDVGGRVTQKGTGIMLTPAASRALSEYYTRLEDERLVFHAAGARGDIFEADDIIPPQGTPDLQDDLVNPLSAPAYNSKFYCGDATSVDSLDSSDKFGLAVVDNMWLSIQERKITMRPISMKGDKARHDSPFYLMNVSPKMWNDFYVSTTNKDWQTLMAAAMKRAQMFQHPIFSGDCLMYRNILIKPVQRYVGFNVGSGVEVRANDRPGTLSTETAGVPIHRGMLLGAQAIGQAWGNAVKNGKGNNRKHFSSHSKKVDHDNGQEESIAWMNGQKKLTFKDKLGYMQDHGVAVFDAAVSAS